VGYPWPVEQSDLSDAALVVLGHGSAKNKESGATVYLQASTLRARRLFAQVREAFWKQEPHIKAVLSELAAPRIFVAPLFISDGYFSEKIIRAELGFGERDKSGSCRMRPTRAQEAFYCKAIGSHEDMTEVVLSRAREVVERFPFPRPPPASATTLFIAGHGTEQDENSRKAVEHQAEQVRAKSDYDAVHAVFLEEQPRISAWHELAVTRNVVVVPFLISDGLHTQEDIPVQLGETERLVRQRIANGQPPWRNPTEKKGKLVWYSPSVGSDPRVADIIVKRVSEAAG
jgi:sirohydrochlorin cobaltochelatase